MSFFLYIHVILLTSFSTTYGLKLWDQPSDLPSSIPVSCRATLAKDINCGPSFVAANNVLNGLPYTEEFLDEYCTDSCRSSLEEFQTAVAARCRGLEYSFTNTTNMTADTISNALYWAYNVTCVQDKDSGAYCAPELFNATEKPCGDCSLRYQSMALQLPEYGEKIVERAAFSSSLSSCGVPESSYTVPSSTSRSSSPTTSATPTSDCYGKKYTSRQGDTCKSVAQANSIGQDIFIAENKLAYNCEDIQAGTELCLGDTCKIHEVQTNESCKDIVSQLDQVSVWELSSWNPTIHTNCDNIGSMEGRLICVSPPGTEWTPHRSSIPGINNGNDSPSTLTSFKPEMQTTDMITISATPSEPVKQSTAIWGIPTPSTRTNKLAMGNGTATATDTGTAGSSTTLQ